jgi:malate dehydrogenase (oxaloacetate-decarboxylating)
MVAPTFGGINLEDIKAPECFYVEETLRKELDIPVFHDDQHGTAVVMLAGLINALKITGRNPGDLQVVVSGAGAAGVACTKMLIAFGVGSVVVCDSRGAIHPGRDLSDSPSKQWLADNTNPKKKTGSLKDVIAGADVFVGVSRPDVLDRSDIEKMNEPRIVFAMSNPDPEVSPDDVHDIVAVMATGRSDYPNQINNVLAFPGIFRGALDVRASDINEEMKLAAAHAIAESIDESELHADYIIPSVFNRHVGKAVADAVHRAARKSGVARRTPKLKQLVD